MAEQVSSEMCYLQPRIEISKYEIHCTSCYFPLPTDSPHVPCALQRLSHALAGAKYRCPKRGIRREEAKIGPQALHPSWPLQKPAPVEYAKYRLRCSQPEIPSSCPFAHDYA